MKKLLYTTSALVGAAFLMEAVVPAKAEVNMSLRYRAALVSKSIKDEEKKRDGLDSFENDNEGNEDVKYRSTALNSAKINIDLSASKDHPNGLTTSVTLAAATAAGKLDYDNAFGSIAGSFGKIDVGDFHDVGYRALGYGTPGTSNFGAIDAGFQPSGGYVNTSATGNIGKRASGIAYWSPSFSGAQIGVSWHPQVTTYKDKSNPSKGSDGIEGKSVGHATNHGDTEDSIGLVATYSGSFGGTGVSMGVSYETMSVASRGVTTLNYSDVNLLDSTATIVSQSGTTAGNPTPFSRQKQDPSAFAGYVSFDIQNFTIGGSYGSWEAAAADATSTSESTAMALGASYSVDAITFGVGYGKQSTETTYQNYRFRSGTSNNKAAVDTSSASVSDLDNDILAFTVGYQLGDGAAIDFVIEQSSADKLTLPAGSDAASVREVKTSGFGVGIDLKF